MSRAIGLDIGGTHVKAVLVDGTGVILERARRDTGDTQNAWRDAITQCVAEFESRHGPADAIGVSCPGIARPDGSGISWMLGRMAGVVDFDFTAHLNQARLTQDVKGRGAEAQHRVRALRRVPVLNDGLAALAGEAWVGAARGLSDAVLLTLGTGVGGAILSGGRLIKGHTGRAGHLGHITVNAAGPLDICNTPGSLEHALGNYSLAERTGGRFSTTQELVDAHNAGDIAASAAWLASIDKLAAAIASIVNAVDPQRVIIGGGIAHAGESLFAPLRAALDRVEWRPFGGGVEVVPAALGEWAGAIGAAGNAMTEGHV